MNFTLECTNLNLVTNFRSFKFSICGEWGGVCGGVKWVNSTASRTESNSRNSCSVCSTLSGWRCCDGWIYAARIGKFMGSSSHWVAVKKYDDHLVMISSSNISLLEGCGATDNDDKKRNTQWFTIKNEENLKGNVVVTFMPYCYQNICSVQSSIQQCILSIIVIAKK